jgi:HEAT repeat protein
MVSVGGCADSASSPAQPETSSGDKAAQSDAENLTTQPPAKVQDDAVGGTSRRDDASVSTTGSQKSKSQGETVAKDDPAIEEPASPTEDDATVDKQAVLSSLEQLSSEARIERLSAIEALDELGPGIFPCVVEALRSGTQAQKRGAATYLIGRVSPGDNETAAALADALGANDQVLRRSALQAVERLPDESLRQTLPALLVLVQNEDEAEAYRSRAVRAISKLGAGDAESVKVLVSLAGEGHDLNLRRSAFFALTKVAPAEVAEKFFLRELAHGTPADLRRLAAKWLGRVAVSEDALMGLVDAFDDPEKVVRMEAVDSLVIIGKPAVAALIRGLDANDVQVRQHSALTLGKLGPLAADAIPALEEHLDDPDLTVRRLASAALRIIRGR